MFYRPERRSPCIIGIAASIAVVLAAVGCGLPVGPLRARATDTWTRSYQLSKTGEVSINNVNGRVDIEGVDGSTVDVSAERVARGATDQIAGDLLKRVVISDSSTPDSVSVRTEKVDGILIGASFEVRYHVKVPKTATVHASTVNGGVEARSVGGKLIVRTTNGGIVATGITGGVEARVVNGGVRVQLAEVGKGEVVMSTVNGGVRLVLPDTAKATVSASWVNGGMRKSGLNFDVRDDSRRHFEGLLNGGGTTITLNTVNGGIALASRGDDVKGEKDENDAPRAEKLAE
jgi:Putative adhesin